MKKVLTIVLVMCLAFCSVFAEKGKAEVGVVMGYAEEFFQMEYSLSDYSYKFVGLQPGFNITGTAAYGITDDVSLKAEVGVTLYGKLKTQITVNGINGEPEIASEATPMNFNFYVGGEYEIEFSRGLAVCAGLGADIMMGKQTCADNETSNTRIGLGFEAIAKYAINKNLNVSFGGRFAVHFVNTGDKTTASLPYAIDQMQKWVDTFGGTFSRFQGAFRVFAGVTYSL